ncbi:hypothetical protein T484DRAFT_1798258 [Baffinella frigidus]|nr:hypothetical protein T484DRAFT_1798258 [Cryptophyta sp. CCMP2293]
MRVHAIALSSAATLLVVCGLVVLTQGPHSERVELESSWFTQSLAMLNPGIFQAQIRLSAFTSISTSDLPNGLREGENKDPDDPWGYNTPRCRGLPTCSSSTSSPAIKAHQHSLQQQKVKGSKAKNLSMPQQYARIMQNQGYFAPWSRVNSWEDRVAINNVRKANSPQLRP